MLPDEIFSRPKHGFEVPLLMWFKKDLKHLIEDKILSEDFIKEQGIFNYKEISSLKQNSILQTHTIVLQKYGQL